MAVPSTGPVSFADLATEFQTGTGALSLSSFYRGGALVPNIPQNMNVPTSGSISLLQMRGSQRGTSVAGSVSGSSVSFNNGNATSPTSRAMSGTATANPSGGSGSYTYNWTVVTQSGGVSNVSLTTPTAKTVTVNATVALNSPGTVNLRCTISDGTGSVQPTGSVDFNYYNTV